MAKSPFSLFGLYKSKVLIRVLVIGIMSVTCFLLGLYGASAIVFKNGQYAVSIVSEDNDTRAIALSETVDFTNPTTTLNCTGISEMTNISEASLPLNLDDTDGSHNGKH